jgi:hypothetical protein
VLTTCEISSSHGGEYEAQNLLGCTAVFLIETSVDNYLTRHYIPEDNSERLTTVSHKNSVTFARYATFTVAVPSAVHYPANYKMEVYYLR